jgi:hypothetical protein
VKATRLVATARIVTLALYHALVTQLAEYLPLKQERVRSLLTERTNFGIRSSSGQSIRLLSEKVQDRGLPDAPSYAPVAERI